MPGVGPNDLLGDGSLGELGPDRTLLNPDGGIELPAREDDSNYNFDREAFRDQTVYFDFDSSTVRPGERAKIKSVASYLQSDPTTKVRVEGHCDERGTSEYNRALGERRALSIREHLVGEGIAPDRVNTISYGEDRPAVLGNDPAAWDKNRRGEFVLMRPKT